jgi:hypothetical protein
MANKTGWILTAESPDGNRVYITNYPKVDDGTVYRYCKRGHALCVFASHGIENDASGAIIFDATGCGFKNVEWTLKSELHGVKEFKENGI